jgi:TolB-like protein
MASIITGYEYDIFISYRHNDNRSGWVSEFVSAFREELAATVKEPVSVYFDTNPQDGLFETHNVGKSLEGKLRCLIFIPVISQTYCDPTCFAWENEFKAFNKSAKNDRFGRDIRLANGNVAGRILPVKIHNLDQADTTLIENEMGGVLRAIEFIYTEAGVNRPLRPIDDAKENLNKTQYRNQVNKLANAVKEIIIGARIFYNEKEESPSDTIPVVKKPVIEKKKSIRLKIAIWSFIIAGILISSYFLLPSLFKTPHEPFDRSIAVLPLDNLSNDPSQEYFSEGIMQEILNHLFMIGGLKIPSATSCLRLKGSKLSVREIASELGVSFVLEGSASILGNNVRIIVRLVNGKNEEVLWTGDYRRNLTAIDLLDIQSDVAQKIAENLKVVMDPEVKKRIHARPTENTEAYLLFLKAQQGMGQNEQVPQLLENALLLDPGFADAYAALAFSWLIKGNDLYGKLTREQVLEKTQPLLKKALQLDKNSVLAHTYLASLNLWYKWDFDAVEKEFNIVKQLNPSNSEVFLEFAQYLIIIGKIEDALAVTKKSFDEGDITENKYVAMALAYCFNGEREKAEQTVQTYMNVIPGDNFILYNSMRIYTTLGKYDKVFELSDKYLADKPISEHRDSFLGYLGVASFKTGKKSQSSQFLKELISRGIKSHSGSPSYFAAVVYTATDQKEKALQYLHKAYADREAEMVWLKVDPLFLDLHNDPRFQNLLRDIGFK